jgi:hypothetical protein
VDCWRVVREPVRQVGIGDRAVLAAAAFGEFGQRAAEPGPGEYEALPRRRSRRRCRARLPAWLAIPAYSTQGSIDSQASVWTVLIAATAAGRGRTATARGAASGRGRHGGARRISVAVMTARSFARALIPVSIPVSV